MSRVGPFRISLAQKCQLLFGLAVLLIISAALLVPGSYMETLVHELNMREARQLALVARVWADPAAKDWNAQQQLLDKWWQDNAKELALPEAKPKLIPLPAAEQGVSLVAMLTMAQQLQRPMSIALHQYDKRGDLLPRPMVWQVFKGVWAVVPPERRERISAWTGEQIAYFFTEWGRRVPHWRDLDEFQLECVRKMTVDESVVSRSRAIRKPGRQTVYQYVLAVRGLDTQGYRRRLAGIIDVKLPTDETSEIFWTRVILVLAAVLAGFLAILVFYLISQKLILAPVRTLRGLVERIAGGDLSARSDISTGDEFEELSDAFNEMLSELQRNRDELETINKSLDTRLGELAETNVGLYESNRLKSEFLANVSHELRTPLTSIIGFADLLRDMSADADNGVDRSRVIRYSQNILTSGRLLLDIINDLLDLAKIEAGKMELHRTRFSPVDLCEALKDFFKPMTDKKSQTLIVSVDENTPSMDSDSGKLRQILFNLLSNAVKYVQDGGEIRLEVRGADDGRRVRFVVADDGPGISEEDREVIFEKFHQLDSSVTREHAGTGLGLPISRELCHLLGGTIRVESTLGSGSRFIVELPVQCPESASRPMPSLM